MNVINTSPSNSTGGQTEGACFSAALRPFLIRGSSNISKTFFSDDVSFRVGAYEMEIKLRFSYCL